MNEFEKNWREKILSNTNTIIGESAKNEVKTIEIADEVLYSRALIKRLKGLSLDEKIALVFSESACHMPHSNLINVKAIYDKTNSIEAARKLLEEEFRVSIKKYKNLTDNQVEDIISKGWGAAGIMKEDAIIATKIPSMFHEYFAAANDLQKKYHYCHCPRVRKELLESSDLDSIYCNCGGGFYKDIWEHITGKKVSIKVLKNLFDGDDVCQFKITI